MKLFIFREILCTPDGSQFAIDWVNRRHARNKLVMLVLTGTLCSSDTNYVTHFAAKAENMDCITCVMNYRGIAVEALTPRFYSASNYEDLELVIKHIKTLYPLYSIFAVGTSIGRSHLFLIFLFQQSW